VNKLLMMDRGTVRNT